jgi:oxidase EvaA
MPPTNLFPQSWRTEEGITPTKDILAWVSSLNATVSVDIRKTTLANTDWFYDEKNGQIVNARRSFFQISGFRSGSEEQPILIQDEIGYLGILCKPIDGILHFLMQAKIEPGNVNKIQISPTIQATKSNFTQAHGGAKPAYLDWFLSAEKHMVIVDQIQSEQSSRFWGKRNRNIVVMLSEDTEIEALPSHKWMTLGQIKTLMKIDNLVNMDTRTVLSCIPFYKYDFGAQDTPLTRTIAVDQPDILPKIYRYMNDYKMFDDGHPTLVPLYSLNGWEMRTAGEVEEFVCKSDYPFKVVFCDISIEGREVRHWGQPLFEAQGMATFGLLTRIHECVQEFLVCARPESGCFDKIELGPSVQLEPGENPTAEIDKVLEERYNRKQGLLHDVILSEEGGRFYHEQNKNIVIDIEPDLITTPPPGYWWCTYRTLNKLTQINNILNIQLRNLLSLLTIKE